MAKKLNRNYKLTYQCYRIGELINGNIEVTNFNSFTDLDAATKAFNACKHPAKFVQCVDVWENAITKASAYIKQEGYILSNF